MHERGDQHGLRTRTTLPAVRARRQHGHMSSSERHSRIDRSHITWTGHHVHINPRYAHTPSVDTCRFRACVPTRTSEPCSNLGLDLWCRGTCVSFAFSVVPRLPLHSKTVPCPTRQAPIYTDQGKDKQSHALLLHTYCITTIPPNPRLYVGTTGISAIPKRERHPKRRDPHPVPLLRSIRGEGDTSTERRTRRTTHDHGPESDHSLPPSTPDGPNTSTTLARRRLCVGASTNRYTTLEGDDPNSPPPTGRISGLHRKRTPQRVH